MRHYLILITLLAAVVLSGCATLNKAQCEAGDWHNLGINDGANGLPASHINEHVSACAEHGISINRELYMAGRTQGLRQYCQLERAESDGRAGRTNFNSCTGDIGISFARVYDASREIFLLKQERNGLESSMDNLLRNITADGLTQDKRRAIKLRIEIEQDRMDLLADRISLQEQRLQFVYSQERSRL